LGDCTGGCRVFQTPQYEASVKILIGQRDAGNNLGGYVSGLQQLTATLAEAVESRPLAETVIQELGLGITPEEFLNKPFA
jgi:capsular polysaccharide biosynthesis protein